MDESRAAATLVGLACGDALGRPVVGRSSDAVARDHGRVTEMLAGGTHGSPAGTVTGATALALRLARSLAACGGLDLADAARRYADWLATDPPAPDPLTADALARYAAGADPTETGEAALADRPGSRTAGDGSLTRCVPTALACADREALADAVARESRTTHADPRCVESCVALARVVRELGGGAAPDEAVGAALGLARDRGAPAGVRDALAVATEPEARRENAGDVLDTLETALADALTADSFETAVAASVSRGGRAATVGAVCGAVAGARFGAVPAKWAERVDEAAELRALAGELAASP